MCSVHLVSAIKYPYIRQACKMCKQQLKPKMLPNSSNRSTSAELKQNPWGTEGTAPGPGFLEEGKGPQWQAHRPLLGWHHSHWRQVRSLSTFCLSETRQVWGNRSKAKLTGLWRNKQGAGPTRCLQFPRTGSGEGPPSECRAASPCRGPGSRSSQLLDVKTGKIPRSLEEDSFSAGEGEWANPDS